MAAGLRLLAATSLLFHVPHAINEFGEQCPDVRERVLDSGEVLLQRGVAGWQRGETERGPDGERRDGKAS